MIVQYALRAFQSCFGTYTVLDLIWIAASSMLGRLHENFREFAQDLGKGVILYLGKRRTGEDPANELIDTWSVTGQCQPSCG